MADVKRNRKRNFSDQEVKVLCEGVEANKVILQPNGESHPKWKKKEIWDDIAGQVSACGVATRTVKELKDKLSREQWWLLKKPQNKHDVKNTVKGTPPTDNKEQVGGLIGDETCDRLINGFSKAVPTATQQQPRDHSSKKSSADQVKSMIESLQGAAHTSTAHVSNTDKTPPNCTPYNKDCFLSACNDPASNIYAPNDSSLYDNNEGMGDDSVEIDSEEEDDGNSDDDEDCVLLPDLYSDSHSGSSQHRTPSHTATPPHPSTETLQIKTKVDIDSADSSPQGKGQPSSAVLINQSDQPSPYTLYTSVVNSQPPVNGSPLSTHLSGSDVSGRQVGRDVSNEDLASSGAEPHSGVAPSVFKSPQRPSSFPRRPSPSTKMPSPSPNSPSMPSPSPNSPSMPSPSTNPPSMPNPSPNPLFTPNPSPNPLFMPSPSPNSPSMPSPSTNPPSMPSPSTNPPSMPNPSPNPPSMPNPSSNPPSMPSAHPYRNYGLSVGDRLNELRNRRVIVAVMRDIDLALYNAEFGVLDDLM